MNGPPAAYRDLVRIGADTVGLSYETGDFSAYETIGFRRVSVSRLTRSGEGAGADVGSCS
ncbi:sialidase family protein [Streptomyces bullii]|uniref:Sialidase family protein n=1 Tax=Streptomyces bullii TaxID=349910 RepID=A0ABW0V2H2_9ACTN